MVDANLERRRQIYKNVRKDIERDEEAKKELQYQRKMTELEKKAQEQIYPYSQPPASRDHHYTADTCPNAKAYLEQFLRWATFCEKYTSEHCEQAAAIVQEVADRNRR